MKMKGKIQIGIIFLIGILLISLTGATYMRSNPQFTQYQPSPGLFGLGSSLEFNEEMCKAGQDFVVQIAPFGCTPAVVRSDLLEEQDVPVFCQLSATQINPLIDVEAIEGISFTGDYPDEIVGIGFQPARAALGVKRQRLNTPVLENIGYAVIVLRKQENVSKMPKYVEGTLDAKIKYDIENALGVGKASYYLPVLSDKEWDDRKEQYSFWDGRGYLRAEGVGVDSARISVYDDTNKIKTVELKEGETSEDILLPGFHCLATLNLRLHELENPDTKVLLKVDSDNVEVVEGEKFLEDKCQVTDILKTGVKEKVTIRCKEDEAGGIFGISSKSFDLEISPRLTFNINGEEKVAGVGDLLYPYREEGKAEERYVYVGYIGSVKGTKDLTAVLISMPIVETKDGKLSDRDLRYVANLVKAYDPDKMENLWDAAKNLGSFVRGIFTNSYASIVEGKKTEFLSVGKETSRFNKKVGLVGFADPINEEFDEQRLREITANYEKAKDDYEYIRENFASEKIRNAEIKPEEQITYGEEALHQQIRLANDLEQKKTVAELCEKFKEEYPKSKKDLNACEGKELSNLETSSSIVFVNGRSHKILLKGISEPSREEYSADILIRGPNQKTKSINLQKGEIVYLDDFRYSKDMEFNLGKEIDVTTAIATYYSLGIAAYFKENLYMKYDSGNGQWLWRAYTNRYNPVNDEETLKSVTSEGVAFGVSEEWKVNIGKGLAGITPQRADFIRSFKGKTFEEGAKVIRNYLGSESIQLIDLDDDKAKVSISVSSKGAVKDIKDIIVSDSETLRLEIPKALNEYSFTLTHVNLEKSARVSVNPGIENAGSNTTFPFKIGIEQRSIKLSPEKTKEIIDNLNESIEKWEERSEKLGKVVKGLKGACLGVGAWLTVKNFFANIGGRGIARQKVMNDYWEDKCKELIRDGDYNTLSECYSANAPEIENDVESLTNIIEEQNAQAKKDQIKSDAVESGGVLSDKRVNTDKLMQTTAPRVNDLLEKGELLSYEKDGTNISMNQYITYEAYKEGKITQSEIQEIETNARIIQSDETSDRMKKIARERLNDIYSGIYDTNQAYAERARLEAEARKNGLGNVQFTFHKGEDVEVEEFKGNPAEGKFKDIKKGELIQGYIYNGEKYYLSLEKIPGSENEYHVKEVYTLDGLKVKGEIKEEIKTNVVFKDYNDPSTYNNPYKEPEVRYFETEPYRGLPQTVPIDVKKGWYASIPQTLPIGAQIRAYDASGRVNSFYLCNVGVDGREENRRPDDECHMINTGTGMPYDQILGLSETEAKRLVGKAIQAIEEASRQYKSGISGQIKILGQIVNIGAPAVNMPDAQCENFMSPGDCKLLFNVCDPVICPSSRCNFGGKYPVQDVVQTGIIGSLVLCLPNFPYVYVPVCLTGVQAGMDGWISIETAYRDCLQESLETGSMTGICDEIYSIHACEFFWRQAIPIAKLAIPKIIELFSGKTAARGGGEYLGVQNAWNTMEKSINSFTQYYAANSFRAFQARTTEEVGTEICQNYVSGVFPNGDFLDAFTEPDSPSQFHARFDEIDFTTTTVPPISHYKVFYHIYAGKDRGAYYKVYLKGTPGGSYYQDVATSRLVDSGYIKVGDTLSETKDFTAPSGYKELCVNVNGQEECGFKSVSTSFAVNYVKEQYVEEQATQMDIKTETECISGRTSIYSLLTPSPEAAADELINPAIYENGIIRVCASENPGKGTDVKIGTNESRWREVGYCGDRNIKCWLDTESIEGIVRNLETEEQILEELNENSQQLMEQENGILDDNSIDVELKKGKTPEEKIKIVSEIYNKVILNRQKAMLRLERAEAYGKLARKAFEIEEKRTADVKKAQKGREMREAAEAGEKTERREQAEVEEGLKEKGLTEELLKKLSDAEKRFLLEKVTRCEDCGGGQNFLRALITNKCQKDECDAIGALLNKNCVFTPRIGEDVFGGSCKEEKPVECSQITNKEQCIQVGGYLQKECNWCGPPLDFCYDTSVTPPKDVLIELKIGRDGPSEVCSECWNLDELPNDKAIYPKTLMKGCYNYVIDLWFLDNKRNSLEVAEDYDYFVTTAPENVWKNVNPEIRSDYKWIYSYQFDHVSNVPDSYRVEIKVYHKKSCQLVKKFEFEVDTTRDYPEREAIPMPLPPGAEPGKTGEQCSALTQYKVGSPGCYCSRTQPRLPAENMGTSDCPDGEMCYCLYAQ